MGDWWIDEAPWPGPAEPLSLFEVMQYAMKDSTTWQYGSIDPVRSLRTAFVSPRRLGKNTALHEALEKMLGEITEHQKTVLGYLEPLARAHDEVEKREKGRGRVRNHGPRPSSTFDRRGRRRY